MTQRVHEQSGTHANFKRHMNKEIYFIYHYWKNIS